MLGKKLAILLAIIENGADAALEESGEGSGFCSNF